jgi:hypothetical protein
MVEIFILKFGMGIIKYLHMKRALATALSLVMVATVIAGDKTKRLERRAMKKADGISAFFVQWQHLGAIKADSMHIDIDQHQLDVYLNVIAMQVPARADWINRLREETKNDLGRRFKDYTIDFLTKGRMLEEYVPNAFRDGEIAVDPLRMGSRYAGIPLKKNLHQPDFISGLSGSHLAVWPSHGLYYDQFSDRWQWQRARLWQTVEDIFPWTFTVEYLVPMLENAGAVVLLPRERDPGDLEIIIDHDVTKGVGRIVSNASWDTAVYAGFKWSDTLYEGQNPFREGYSMSASMLTGDFVSLSYVPEFPRSDDFAVYVSYARTHECISNALYTINHSGGKAEFSINQCMGAGTWIYLGNYQFKKGLDINSGSVVLEAKELKGILSSDAVRFGGGIGNVARKPATENDTIGFHYKTSGKPRWMEGSRYYLQYSGMPDSVVYNLHKGKNDYNDDYMSRPEWVNFMIGSSRPQYSDKYRLGMGIPIDLSLAFHTDAGVAGGDSLIGTLGIYSTPRQNGIFPDGRSKLAGRDLTDLVQTQLVEDLRRQADPRWIRRGLWDREYSEAWRPIVPSMLLELLSHQNLADMKFGLDPRFKFLAARAVYKGILRFSASNYGLNPVVQPLPPDHLAIQITGERKIRITWQAVEDPLEPSATAKSYRVTMKTGENGFNGGIITSDNALEMELPAYSTLYSFRVTALNDGGESFPSETLSAGLLENDLKPVLVVNAFDRICGPAFFDQGDMAGIEWWEDEGVPNRIDRSFTGFQYNFDRNSEWLHDDSPGWGASSAAMESTAISGNTFSFPAVHGKALMNAGRSFVSVSDEAFENPAYAVSGFDAIDIIFGEERSTQSMTGNKAKEFKVFTPAIAGKIRQYTALGGHVFISGAYIGTDMAENNDTSAMQFAAEVLHYTWRSNHATTLGQVYATDHGSGIFPQKLQFNTTMNEHIYRVESPDAIEPLGAGAIRICRYMSGNASAGVAYRGNYRSVALGFPFETIPDEDERTTLMKMILNFFFAEEGN